MHVKLLSFCATMEVTKQQNPFPWLLLFNAKFKKSIEIMSFSSPVEYYEEFIYDGVQKRNKYV